MSFKPEYLVVDTTAFIQNAPLQDIGVNIVTIQEVVDEITSKRQLRRLIVLPYELKIMNVFTENVVFVSEFSKKTGDYPSLSATDIKLMALAYQLEKQHVGVDHLKTAPEHNRSISLKRPEVSALDPVGFFKGDHEAKLPGDQRIEDLNIEGVKIKDDFLVLNDRLPNQPDQDKSIGIEKDNTLEEDLYDVDVKDILKPVSECDRKDQSEEESEINDRKEESEGESEIDEDENKDESEWITPENIQRVKRLMDFGLVEDKEVKVACITTDFAMQNVMKQVGLNILSLDGRVIKHLRTFILRCYACFNTTSNMTKTFCPKCGHKTLKKVSVSVDENGKQVIHINPRRPLTARGKKFSLPRPQGGKHSNNPILCEDQPTPDQRPTRLARTKTNPLDDDYIAGFSPFAMKDVNSKSAMLGVTSKNQQVKYWMRKNPNEVIKFGKKKK